jgi:hypothetical protein
MAGFKGWLELRYCVKKRQRAIRILAPLPIKERDLPSGEPIDSAIGSRSSSTTNASWPVTLTGFEVRAAEAARDQLSAPAGSTKRDGSRGWDPPLV